MAVVDTYVNSEVDAVTGTFTGNAIQAQGSGIKVVTATFIPAAGDDDGSVYRLFKDIPSNVVPLRLDVMTDGVTGMDDVDFGIYKTDKGDVVDKDIPLEFLKNAYHPVGAQAQEISGNWTVNKVVMSRSARILMEGWVRIPADSF